MKTFIIKYWLEVLLTSIMTFFLYIFKQYFGLKNGMKSLLRNEIVRIYEKYIIVGYCPSYMKENLNEIYLSYHKLGGNCMATAIVEEIFIKKHSRGGKIDKQFYNYLNFDNIVYIDSLSILEFNNERVIQNLEEGSNFINYRYPYHIQQLSRKLKNTNNKGIYDEDFYKELDVFKRKMDDMIGGNFKYDDENKRFLLEINGEDYRMENTSSGLKQLGIIQLLLENRELTENSFLILDEPEVHLHPGFQVQLAEILVLLAKDLNVRVYINTHSPFLAEAIEVYSKFHRIYDQTNFYLTEESENEGKFDYILMDEMDIMEVYNNLGHPFNTLNEIRFETELRND